MDRAFGVVEESAAARGLAEALACKDLLAPSPPATLAARLAAVRDRVWRTLVGGPYPRARTAAPMSGADRTAGEPAGFGAAALR